MKHSKLAHLVIVALVLAVVGLFAPAKPVQAQSNPYAVLCVTNNTDAQISYSYRWGNGSWKSSTLDTEDTDIHSWRYTSGTSSPNFKIRFDTDAASGIYLQIYNLDRYQAPTRDCTWGKNYAFEYVDWESIDLYAED